MSSDKKYHFEDYVERANAAGSVEALFKVFVDTVKLHGLDRTIFSLSTEHNDIGVPAQRFIPSSSCATERLSSARITMSGFTKAWSTTSTTRRRATIWS